MIGRLVGLFGLVAAFVLTAQLRGASLVHPNLQTTLAMAGFVVGLALLAAVVSGGIRARARKVWQPPGVTDNQRQTYRIVYPAEAQPLLLVDQLRGDPVPIRVIDVSEEGLRLSDATNLLDGTKVEGTLLFADESSAYISGKVVRRSGQQVCLHLIDTVPANLIVKEQLRLRRQAQEEIS